MQYNKQLQTIIDLPEDTTIVKTYSLHKFLIEKSKFDSFKILPLGNDCSTRLYYRILNKNCSMMLMDSSKEIFSYFNFIHVAKWLHSHKIKAPEIIDFDDDNKFLLLEDFGDATLSSYLSENPEKEISLYKKSIDILISLHKKSDLDSFDIYSPEVMNEGLKTNFINKYLRGLLPENLWRKAHKELIRIFYDLYPELKNLPEVLVLRDYHAENIMVTKKESLGIIDFQDAMKGNPTYDILSLLEDARRDISNQVTVECINHYLSETGMEENKFNQSYAILSAQRNLRLIGLFYKLSYLEKKSKYEKCLPRVIKYFKQTLKNPKLSKLNEWVINYNILNNDILYKN